MFHTPAHKNVAAPAAQVINAVVANLADPISAEQRAEDKLGDVSWGRLFDERTFAESLKSNAWKLGAPSNRRTVLHIIAQARANADTTVLVEKERAIYEWNEIFKGSLRTLLTCGLERSYGIDKRTASTVKRWFAHRGIVG